jgi:hypothetical protein
MKDELTIYKEKNTSSGSEIYFDVDKFEQAQRVAKMFASSTMVPEHFRNNVGNCMIGLNFAARVGLDPFMCLQKMYIIHGKPGIEAQLMIALINRSGRFTPLKFKLDGEGKSLQCTCYATEKSTGEECEQTIDWGMVTAEGWDKKAGSKWKTMPKLMIQYRSAAFFGRLYCPEAIMGMMSNDELHDIAEPVTVTHSSIADRLQGIPETTGTDQVVEPVPETPKPNPLHKTNEWAKYKEACDIAPDIAKTLPVPKTAKDCLKAAEQINRTMDARNA